VAKILAITLMRIRAPTELPMMIFFLRLNAILQLSSPNLN
jgi:hypothetical protein